MFTPQGQIYLLKNQSLDNSYEHTFRFKSIEEQQAYFINDVHTILDDYTYIRGNSLKVNINRENLYSVNYLMYKNLNEGKWIYSFILDKIYINETTTELILETDVMQTFHFDYEFMTSHVEREHIPTSLDTIDSNFTDEGLETGMMISNYTSKTGKNDIAIVLVVASETTCQITQGLMSACKYFAYTNSTTGCTKLAEKITELTNANKIDTILALTTCSTLALGEFEEGQDVSSKAIGHFDMSYTIPQELDGYTPKNKKLLHYPYSYLEITTPTGESRKYLYEYFEGLPTLSMYANLGVNPTLIMTPKDYKGNVLAMNESISIDSYPQCAYITDSFKIWLSKQIPQIASSIVTLGASALLAPVTGGVSLGVGVASTLGNVVGSVGSALQEPNKARGNLSSNMLASIGMYDFLASKMTITSERARQLDDYLTTYGYKCNRMKIPYTHSRSTWNYIKTLSCNLKSSISINDLSKIKSVYNNGVTLWHYKGSKIYIDYSQDNV